MTGQPTADAFASYSRALEASAQVEAAQVALRDASAHRLSQEAELARLYDDLDRITGWNAATWWPRLTGRIRDRQAAVTTAIITQEPVTQRAVIAHEQALRRAAEIGSLVDQLPAARQRAAESLTGPAGEEARVMLTELAKIQASLQTTARARLLAAGTSRSLGRAEGWSTYDLLGGGMVSSAMKYEHLDDANASSVTLTELLTELRPQLQALGAPTAYFSVNAHDANADIWWDNPFTDAAAAGRISDAGDRVDRLQVGLGRLAESLGQQHQELVRRLDDLLARSKDQTSTG